jgi:hypothetical protein
MKTNIEFKYQTAWLIGGWSMEAKKGKAITFTYIDFYEKTSALFIMDGETLPKLYEAKRIVYTLSDAIDARSKDISDKLKYYEEQVVEANNKVKSIQALVNKN